MARAGRLLAAAAWGLLGALALAGAALSALALLAATPLARPLVARLAVRAVDAALAGSVSLDGISVLPHGGLELRGLRVFDPDGHLVLEVGRAVVLADVTALRDRTLGLTVSLDRPSVLLEEEEGGGVSIARAFAPAHPSARQAAPDEGGGWTIHLSRLEVRGGDVWWMDARGATRAQASGLDVDARALLAPDRTRAEVRLRGALAAPVEGPLALDAVLSRDGAAVRVPLLRVEVAGTGAALVAEGDLASRRGRAALTHLGLSRADARAVLPETPAGADLRATGYAESDGTTATGALRVEPSAGPEATGRGDAAAAVRLAAAARAAGFDVALDRLDPSRLAATAPAGALTLAAHGAAAGTSLDDLRGRLALSVAPSRLGGGEVTRAEVVARLGRSGALDLDRLAVAAPGVAVTGKATWRRAGAVSGALDVDAPDLAVAAKNAALLAGAAPPAVAGRGRATVRLAGTAAAPSLEATVEAPAVRSGALRATGLRLALSGAGPLGALHGRVEGQAAAVLDGARELARGVVLHGTVDGADGAVSLTGAVPGARDPLALELRGRLGARRDALLLSTLQVSYPGARWALAGPAAIDLRGPSVDRLELAAGEQRISIAGGVGPRRALAATVELVRLDLARLPAGLLAPEDRIAGVVSAELDAAGTVARPVLDGRIALEGGAYRGLAGLAATGRARLDAAARRASVTLTAARADGGTVTLSAELPVPLAARPAEPLSVRLEAAGLPAAPLLAALHSDLPVAGSLGVTLSVDGTAGAPRVRGEVTAADASYEDLRGIAALLSFEDPGDAARATLEVTHEAARVLAARVELPLPLAPLLRRPEAALREARSAPLRAEASVTSLSLERLAGRAGLPQRLAGIVDAQAKVTGSVAAPRGTATVDLAGGAVAGWTRLGGRVALAATDRGLSLEGRATFAGQEALRVTGSLSAVPERLGDRAALLGAALRADAVVPRVSLAAAAGEAIPLSGTIEGKASLTGSARAPRLAAELTGAGVVIEGRPLGDAAMTARYAAGRGEGEATLRPASGGTLRATLAVDAELGAGARAPLGDAPAVATLRADRVQLGFLPAVAPGIVRSAAGELTADVRAEGPLARLSPRGTARVADGRLAIAEYGEWTGIAALASVSDDAVELSRLEVRRGAGRLSAAGSLRGLRGDGPVLQGHLTADGFTVARAGMELATVTIEASATGTYRARQLAVEVKIPRGVVRLPRKTPRTLQPLDARKDIVVAPRQARPPRAGRAPAAAGAEPASAAAEAPLSLAAHVVAPRDFFVKSDSPKIDIELKADVHYELTAGQDYAEGTVEVVRGSVEPIGGRTFNVEHGKVQFTGGPPSAALLDVQARYDNPAAVVTVNVAGPATKPEIRLSSQPPMDDAQIAMLIATGRTEMKAGSGGVGTLTGEEAGKAALGVVVTQAFRNLVQDKLPLDTVALDSGALRAGKYVTDKIYVGYTRRFDADPQKGENEDEVRVEYQISPRWTFESRYGNAQSGGANLIWSRDY